MPILTHSEVDQVAKGIVNMMVADLLFENPGVRKAVDKIKRDEWAEALSEFERNVKEVLLNRFGVSD